jgi:hypothetical protein
MDLANLARREKLAPAIARLDSLRMEILSFFYPATRNWGALKVDNSNKLKLTRSSSPFSDDEIHVSLVAFNVVLNL